MMPTVSLEFAKARLCAGSLVELFVEEKGPVPLPLETLQPGGASPGFLAPLGSGQLQREVGEYAGIRVLRETFRPDGEQGVLAVRLQVTNQRGEPVALATLTPVCVEAGGLCLDGVPAAQWTYIRQP
ncbi:MAG: hypothetical protein QHJ73_19645, partial [Armatimonadota bacterium]|nr:hypothetical protein [Armatimonadota bacterium]